MRWTRGLLSLLAALVLVAACGSAPAGPGAAGQVVSGQVAASWQQSTITDVDGVAFNVAEISDAPVFVEFFATWCSNCRAQLAKTNEAAAQAGSEAVFLALSVETDLNAADLVAYRDSTGYSSLRYAVMTPEVLALVVGELGNTAANPPSTPHLSIVGGETGPLVTGFEEPDNILTGLGLR